MRCPRYGWCSFTLFLGLLKNNCLDEEVNQLSGVNRVLVPFIACGDLSGFDSDGFYDLKPPDIPCGPLGEELVSYIFDTISFNYAAIIVIQHSGAALRYFLFHFILIFLNFLSYEVLSVFCTSKQDYWVFLQTNQKWNCNVTSFTGPRRSCYRGLQHPASRMLHFLSVSQVWLSLITVTTTLKDIIFCIWHRPLFPLSIFIVGIFILHLFSQLSHMLRLPSLFFLIKVCFPWCRATANWTSI